MHSQGSKWRLELRTHPLSSPSPQRKLCSNVSGPERRNGPRADAMISHYLLCPWKMAQEWMSLLICHCLSLPIWKTETLSFLETVIVRSKPNRLGNLQEYHIDINTKCKNLLSLSGWRGCLFFISYRFFYSGKINAFHSSWQGKWTEVFISWRPH